VAETGRDGSTAVGRYGGRASGGSVGATLRPHGGGAERESRARFVGSWLASRERRGGGTLWAGAAGVGWK
jgi:hypothetical protein